MTVRYRKTSKEKKWQLWNNMFTRCYNPNYHISRPDYGECTICKEWLDNRKSFYEWVDAHYYVIEGETIELDKDILVPGNKEYSPDACCFVPKEINDLFVNVETKNRKGLPTGVTKTKAGTYQATVHINGKSTNLGRYDTPEEAFEQYLLHKKAHVMSVADKYKDVIPGEIYDALLNWTIQ